MTVAEFSKASKAFLSAGVVNAAMRPSNDGRQVHEEAVRRLAECGLASSGLSVRQLVWRCDRWLRKNYRNDHVYRTSVLQSLLREKHARVIPEFRVNLSQADFLVAGSDLHVVELKSELDTLDRLERQVADYRLVASRISVVGSPALASRMLEDGRWAAVGVSTLGDDGLVRSWREARPDHSQLNSMSIMRCMRRSEYLDTLRLLGFDLPPLPNTRVFTHALQLAATVPASAFHDAAAVQLAMREPRVGMGAIARVPRPLRAIVLRINPGRSQLQRFYSWLNSEVEYVCSKT